MLLIDKQFLDTPFYGVRQMTWHLQNEGHAVNEKRIRRLMRLMRLMPIYQKPNTSKPAKGHKTYRLALFGSFRVLLRIRAVGARAVFVIYQFTKP
ncbi:MAG: IS3 family transposase [Pseudorhodobacter sp.]|nr:IS3 family transposase [Pseudorhodobacter sp.]